MQNQNNGLTNTILQSFQWSIEADALPTSEKHSWGEVKLPTLSFGWKDNLMNITVSPNSTEYTRNNGKITVDDMDINQISALMGAIDTVATSIILNRMSGGTHQIIEGVVIQNMARSFQPDTKGQMWAKSKTVVGTDDRGVFITIVMKNAPEIKFYLANTKHGATVQYKMGGGIKDDPLMTSAMVADGFQKLILGVISNVATDNYATHAAIKERRAANKQNRGGYNGSSAGNAPSYTQRPHQSAPQQQSPADFENDLNLLF